VIEIDGPQHRNRAAADHDGHSIPAPNTSSVVIALAAYHESAMTLPREPLKIGDAGYDMSAAPPDAWRLFDPEAPDPGYFEFDWISARHPDLYHRFALTTEGLTAELQRLVDFRGLDVIDVGAGTGRSAIGLASSASHVLAVDAYAGRCGPGGHRPWSAARRARGRPPPPAVAGPWLSGPLRRRDLEPPFFGGRP
jgi:hypothetical protein